MAHRLAGTIPLAFASSAILRTFFALIFGTIMYALLIGLMLMPVLFSLVGPPPLKFAAPNILNRSHASFVAAMSPRQQSAATPSEKQLPV